MAIEFERIRTGRVRSFIRKGKRVNGFRRRKTFKDGGRDSALETKARQLSAKSSSFTKEAETIEFTSRSLRGFDYEGAMGSSKKSKNPSTPLEKGVGIIASLSTSAVSGSRAARNVAQAAEIGQRIKQKSVPKTGVKGIDRALSVGFKVARIAGTAAGASKSVSIAARNIAGVFQSGRKLRVEEAQTDIKRVQVSDEIARTALWEKSLEQSDRKKDLLEQQLRIKQTELETRDAKLKEKSGRIKVKGFKRKDGTVVKASTRNRKKQRGGKTK